jgi:hypothetical protein
MVLKGINKNKMVRKEYCWPAYRVKTQTTQTVRLDLNS